jgi:hypothetical protein
MAAVHTPEALTPAAFYGACQATLLEVPFGSDSHVYWGRVGLVPESTGETAMIEGEFRLNDYHTFETRNYSEGIPGADEARYRQLLENGTSILGITLYGPNGSSDRSYPNLPYYSLFRPSDVAEERFPTGSLIYPYDLKRFPDELPPITIEEGHWDKLVVVKATPNRSAQVRTAARPTSHELVAHPGHDPQLWEVYKSLGAVTL